ncbi:hypothetical protein DRN38_00190 [Thermococci archaeon]|nr:MAG: hypothetical protein DRN38_00190 [Thermococci archaeon]
MGRYPKLGPYKVVSFAIEIDKYQILKEIAFQKGKALSDLLREIIDDYLKSHGLLEAEAVAMNGGIKVLSLIEQKLLTSELKELMMDLERLSKKINEYPKGTISWFDIIEKMRAKIRRALTIIQKLGVPSDATLKKLRQYSELVEKSLS